MDEQTDLEQLSWADIKHRIPKKDDLFYDLTVKTQPGFTTETLFGSKFTPEGRPYPLWVSYHIIGSRLLIWSKRRGEEYDEFAWKMVFNLTELDTITSPVVTHKPHWCLWGKTLTALYGEQFFLRPKERNLPGYAKAFVLRFPENASQYRCDEALKFSSLLKRRVLQIHCPGSGE